MIRCFAAPIVRRWLSGEETGLHPRQRCAGGRRSGRRHIHHESLLLFSVAGEIAYARAAGLGGWCGRCVGGWAAPCSREGRHTHGRASGVFWLRIRHLNQPDLTRTSHSAYSSLVLSPMKGARSYEHRLWAGPASCGRPFTDALAGDLLREREPGFASLRELFPRAIERDERVESRCGPRRGRC